MKLLVATDITVQIKDGRVYAGYAFIPILKRYYETFGKVTICSRKKEVREITDTCVEITQYVAKCLDISNLQNVLLNRCDDVIKKAILECDLVVVRVPSMIAYKAAEFAKLLNKPYMAETMGCAWDAYWNHGVLGKLIAPQMYLRMKKVVKNANFATYVTEKFLQERYPTNGKETFYSNVALTEFDNKILERRLERISGNKEKLIIGTTAAVDVKYKGQQYIIEALSKLKKQGASSFEYQLVGKGDNSYLKLIAEKYKVSDQVKFLGAMPHDDIFNWLETIDIYAQPSRQEGLPRALIEAMSRALPAFGARTAGIPELLEDKYIFSNTRHNIDEICEILKSFDSETMIKQAKRNYEESKKYDKDIIEKRRNQFFMEFKSDTCMSK